LPVQKQATAAGSPTVGGAALWRRGASAGGARARRHNGTRAARHRSLAWAMLCACNTQPAHRAAPTLATGEEQGSVGHAAALRRLHRRRHMTPKSFGGVAEGETAPALGPQPDPKEGGPCDAGGLLARLLDAWTGEQSVAPTVARRKLSMLHEERQRALPASAQPAFHACRAVQMPPCLCTPSHMFKSFFAASSKQQRGCLLCAGEGWESKGRVRAAARCACCYGGPRAFHCNCRAAERA